MIDNTETMKFAQRMRVSALNMVHDGTLLT
jgi:hypothetical protein